MEMEVAERYNILRLNYSALEYELEALGLKFEELTVSSASEKILLSDVQQQLEV